MAVVELGNPEPFERIDGLPVRLSGERVTYVSIPDEYSVSDDAAGATEHLAAVAADPTNPRDVTHLPGDEAFVAVTHPRDGVWVNHSTAAAPSWVWSDDERLGQQLAAHYGCPYGHPEDLEATHHTIAGPPGVGG